MPYLSGFDFYIPDVSQNKMKYVNGLKIYGHKKNTGNPVEDENNLELIKDIGPNVHQGWN